MFQTGPSVLYLNYLKPVEIVCCHECLFRVANIQNNAGLQLKVQQVFISQKKRHGLTTSVDLNMGQIFFTGSK